MAKTSVFTALFDDGLPSVNFFNGRLLSAEDLKTETHANRAERRRLGLAIGDGVVNGLSVRPAQGNSADSPVVTVTAGLAVDSKGDTVRLPVEVDVSLLPSKPAAPGTTTVETFDYCK